MSWRNPWGRIQYRFPQELLPVSVHSSTWRIAWGDILLSPGWYTKTFPAIAVEAQRGYTTSICWVKKNQILSIRINILRKYGNHYLRNLYEVEYKCGIFFSKDATLMWNADCILVFIQRVWITNLLLEIIFNLVQSGNNSILNQGDELKQKCQDCACDHSHCYSWKEKVNNWLNIKELYNCEYAG